MATHVTCDGCDAPISNETRVNSGRATVYQGNRIVVELVDLCPTCIAKAADALSRLRSKGPAHG